MKYIFDLDRSARGLRLNRFLHSLTSKEQRALFISQPEAAMAGLSEQEKDMVRRLDWKAMQDYGASFFCLEKLARTKGVSNPQMVAAFRGEALEQFRTHTERFDFAQYQGSVATAFKRVVRNLEFDVAEMAIMTFLVAKAFDKPYRLLPFVVIARYEHRYLVTNKSLAPKELEGKRVGVRSYSVTTGAWIRGILADDYGVDLSKIQWVTFEEAHVAEFRDPPNVQRATAGKDINAMLAAGELDAAILGAIPTDPRLKPVIADPQAAGKRWGEKHRAIQLNHLVGVKNTVSRETADEIYRLLLESKKAAGDPPMLPHGLEANRRNLEVAIDCAYQQKMIPRRFTVKELFE